MNQMNEIEKDRLIADFMGISHVTITMGRRPSEDFLVESESDGQIDYLYLNYLNFSTDGGWLWGIMDKIESLGYQIFIEGNTVNINSTLGSCPNVVYVTGESKQKATYDAIIAFIEYYYL